MDTRITVTHDLLTTLEKELQQVDFSSLFLLTDTNVERCVLPLIEPLLKKYDTPVIVIEAGEEHKNIDSLTRIWQALSEGGATRSSLLVNLGGGVITDISGFAAATFKRGIRYVNIPTTVLGAVDASVGGKTAVDFMGLKNEIGAFHKPVAVILSPQPLSTLPRTEVLSGFAEILKNSLISSEEFYNRTLLTDPCEEPEKLFSLIEESVRFKERITIEDPTEKGLRKILNFGHTAGHAFESWMLKRATPVTHGEAVANGMLVAIILSHLHSSLPSEQIHIYSQNILKRYYRPIPFGCKDQDELIRLMSHDKKNRTPGEVNFVLLEAVGSPIIDRSLTPADIRVALDIYSDLR